MVEQPGHRFFDTSTYMYDGVFMAFLFRRGLLLTPLLTITAPFPAAAQVDLDSIVRDGQGYVARLDQGGLARLTLQPHYQEAVEEVFKTYDVPFGGAVVLSLPDGKVLALAGRSSLDPSLGAVELALRPWAPAASVFKVVAAAALVGEAGLGGGSRACYHGGLSGLLPEHLIDLPRLDRRCDTLAYGIGKSQNAIIAKLVAKHLAPQSLDRVARAFGFGEELIFDAAVEPSDWQLPADRLEFARAAAGFYHSSLSPLHGALVAATIANGGEMPSPRLVETAFDAQGKSLPTSVRKSRRVVDARVAREVGRMMELTTTMGTARNSFHNRRGRPLLPVTVAGKTGSLSYRGRPSDPPPPAAVMPDGGYLGYSWFVGYAPAHKPRVAFAVAIGNHAVWRIKAAFVAQRIVAEHLSAESEGRRPRMLASH